MSDPKDNLPFAAISSMFPCEVIAKYFGHEASMYALPFLILLMWCIFKKLKPKP